MAHHPINSDHQAIKVEVKGLLHHPASMAHQVVDRVVSQADSNNIKEVGDHTVVNRLQVTVHHPQIRTSHHHLETVRMISFRFIE